MVLLARVYLESGGDTLEISQDGVDFEQVHDILRVQKKQVYIFEAWNLLLIWESTSTCVFVLPRSHVARIGFT